ncbi:uncharacterized protein LOC134781261, partial [Penaeus indicus]|uniref:uncharacterized protein LOC134781261 n=1 Tax=Penaeus indicus TaxID=29960 RepID=UPI00300D16CB
AIDSLKLSSPKDNIYLLTTILTIAQRILAQGRRIILNWVPSHIGIRGNELADRLAVSGRGMPPSPMIIAPSRNLLRMKSTGVANSFLLQLHREAIQRKEIATKAAPPSPEKDIVLVYPGGQPKTKFIEMFTNPRAPREVQREHRSSLMEFYDKPFVLPPRDGVKLVIDSSDNTSERTMSG